MEGGDSLTTAVSGLGFLRAIVVFVRSSPSYHFLSLLSTIMMLMVIMGLRWEWVDFYFSSLKKGSASLVGGSILPSKGLS